MAEAKEFGIMMLKDKVIIVTGGAGLIGQTFIRAIVEAGGIAVLADIDVASGTKVKEELSLELHSHKIDFFPLDITCRTSVKSLIRAVVDKRLKIDALVNNAYPRNSNYGRHFFEVTHKDFVENLGLNLGGYFTASQQLSKYFLSQGYGNIVNVSSVYGVIAPKFEIYEGTSMTTPVEYAAIKSGLIHLTKYMANYLKGSRIRVNALSPGGILDGQPSTFLEAYKSKCLNKGMLDASDLTGTLMFLLSDESMYLNGQNLIVDDGFSL